MSAVPAACAFAGALLAAPTAVLAQSNLPPIGSASVALAEPAIPAPPGTPCTVPLFDAVSFIGFDAHTFDFAPPADCPGPWTRVVLSADFDVSMGRQFDRTGRIWLGGANIYFGTTQEPNAVVSPSWHVERDLTDYSALFAQAESGYVELGNVVDGTYTGIIHGSAALVFYPEADALPDHPRRPDAVLPINPSDHAGGGGADLTGDALLSSTLTLPRNVERAFLDVIAQSQASDEFWYTCVPSDLADSLQSCPGGSFRETQVSIDGVPAGVAPIYPWIYTGGVDPYLWRPSPGIQTLAFEPYRVDLSPFAGVLSDGNPHTLALGVFGAQDHFSTVATLLLYLDAGSDQVTGEVTTNTLTTAPTPTVDTTHDPNDATKTQVVVGSTRAFEIAGYVNTSHGRVETDLTQTIAFRNQQDFTISDDGNVFHQDIAQSTAIDLVTTVSPGTYKRVVHEVRNWPLNFNIHIDTNAAGGHDQASSVDQGLERSIEIGIDGYGTRAASLAQRMHSQDTLQFDASFSSVTGHVDQGSAQSFVYNDPYGTCFDRSITTVAGKLDSVTDGVSCPGQTNTLDWFDTFSNSASSLFGATLKVLP